MTTKWAMAVLAMIFMIAPVAIAQNPTATVTGTVQDSEGGVLPGVTVTATSPALQGSRTAVTDANGNYKLAFLNPGTYIINYELDGFATTVRSVKASAAQTTTSDISMELAGVTEEIVVTSNEETISETNTVASTTTQDDLEKLAINRTPLQAVNLAPGVADTGPSTEPSIHGAMSFENLYLVNGVVVNENLRGQFLPLFIEDAISETTTTTAGVSAEYGRFTGGVVNVITKSGGNEFSGSLRVNLLNEDWISDANRFALNPNATPNEDATNEIYEATLGGPIWKDKIWWFASARDREETGTDSTTFTNIQYPEADTEERLELKATISPAQGHTIIGSSLEIDRTRSGSTFGSVLDLRSVTNRTDPQEIEAYNYTGILTSNFFVEAQYSERLYEIATGLGGPQDLIDGTLMRHRPTGRRFWSSTFCGSCEPEQRDNENTLAKASYFLTTEGSGTHDVTFGYDTFTDIRFSVNHQSGSDFQVWAEDIYIDGSNNIFPIFQGSTTWVVWWPPIGLEIAQPTDFVTNSLYANDSWQLNDRWSFNVGVRYDENDGVDSSGNLVTDDDQISPRLGLSYDVKGDGDLVVNASYGTYVAAIANTGNVADGASTGGALSGFFSFYQGPQVNTNCPPDCVTTDVALNTLFDWYFGEGLGGPDVNKALADQSIIPGLFYQSIPGVSQVVRQGFTSPSADELTVGATKRLGNKGLVRGDIVYREWSDFYATRTTPGDISGGTEVKEIGNFANDVYEREYLGVEFQGRYRFTDKFTLAGNYTWSELEGNINGETGGSGPVGGGANTWPEFNRLSVIPNGAALTYPVGNLLADQTHKFRIWGVYDILENEHHSLSVSLLQNFFSGQPFSDAIGVDTTPGSLTGDAIRAASATAAAYVQPPSSITVFPTGRGAYKTDDITRTDLAVNYAFNWSLGGKDFEVFLQPEVVNLFDEDGLTNNTLTDTLDFNNNGRCPNGAGGLCEDFNALTTTPVLGTHYVLDENFDNAEDEDDFQQPRTFRLSVGFRF
jgi:outer membrane receptor protein involved in Fe transport